MISPKEELFTWIFKSSTYVLDSTDLCMARVKKQLNKCSVNHSQQSQHRTSIITVVSEIVNIQKTYRENEDIL